MVFSSLGLIGMPVPLWHVLPCFSFVSWRRAGCSCEAVRESMPGVRILHPDTSSISYPNIKSIRPRYWDVKYGYQALWFLRNPALDVV